MPVNRHDAFRTAIDRVAGMPQDPALRDRLQVLGLNVVNVMWEDTARTPGSVWGPNITDMTLQVRDPEQASHRYLLPVIRYPNFTDKTGDVPLDLLKIKVGNEKGSELSITTLREYLNNLSQTISYPAKFNSQNQPLVTEKDTHVLVSAQACFLPIPPQGQCQFNPVLFNYQSRSDSPAVLAILISTEGTSATVIDNAHDRAEWGQNVYFNHNGQKTCLTGERLSDYKENQAQEIVDQRGISLEEARSQVIVAKDINLVMVIQVPLKQKTLESRSMAMPCVPLAMASPGAVPRFAGMGMGVSDVEDAAIGHGQDEGEHFELGGHKLERDDRYPIRVTVQFYKATSNGIVDETDLENVRQCIETTYASADYVGSLVVGTLEKGELGMGEARPTQPAPNSEAVLGPPKDFLEVVNPFEPHQEPKAGG
ncbi:MAG: hypothetical protein SFW36_02165 [Leptolyngbyaceae cyanobacterium bins.59]|nr:hypothetical protein [Leptolyngbyaceae cyanobacterium bins.59]